MESIFEKVADIADSITNSTLKQENESLRKIYRNSALTKEQKEKISSRREEIKSYLSEKDRASQPYEIDEDDDEYEDDEEDENDEEDEEDEDDEEDENEDNRSEDNTQFDLSELSEDELIKCNEYVDSLISRTNTAKNINLTVDEAVKAFYDRDIITAYYSLKKHADDLDVKAIFYLAFIIFLGMDVTEENDDQAIQLMKLGTKSGDLYCKIAGNIFAFEEDDSFEITNNDYKKLKKLADNNDRVAQMLLGIIYLYGLYTIQDKEKGTELLIRSYNSGNWLSLYFLGAYLENNDDQEDANKCHRQLRGLGLGFTVDNELSYMSSTSDNLDAFKSLLLEGVRLGSLYCIDYIEVSAIDRKDANAYKIAKYCVDRGYPAYTNIGLCYLYGIGTKVNVGIASEYFQKALQNGDAEAYRYLGNIAEMKKDFHLALDCYRRGDVHGITSCSAELARCYEEGIGTEKNDMMADFYTKRADR